VTATTTPVDRSHEAPIRDEIRRVNHAIESLQSSLGPLFDSLSERLAHRLDTDRGQAADRLDAVFAKIDAARREDAAAVKLLIDELEERNNTAILAAHLHFSSEIRRVDGRVDSMGHRVDAVETAIGEKDAVDIVVQDAIADVDKRAKKTDAEMRVFTRGRMGFGFASAALVMAGKSEITWSGVKAWAWSHGLLLTVAVAVLLVAAGVEIHTRLRAQKGPST